MAKVLQFTPRDDSLRCPECGSAWFTVPAVTLNADREVNGYALPVLCLECREEVPPWL